MPQTPNRLGQIDLLSAQQPNAYLGVNTAIEQIAQYIFGVLAIQNSPPSNPAEGDSYIVSNAPTGVWVGHEDAIAHFQNGGWRFYPPTNGWTIPVATTPPSIVFFNGSQWVDVSSLGGEANTITNIGTGAGIHASKNGVNHELKSLKAGSNVTITPSATEIEIAAAGDVASVNGQTGTVDLDLDDITGVNLTSPANNHYLKFDGTNWVNTALPAAPVTSVNSQTGAVNLSLDNLSDTDTSAAVEGDLLTFNDSTDTWEPVSRTAVSPLTTKGDLVTWDTSTARLSVGSNGEILRANSATTTGLDWSSLGFTELDDVDISSPGSGDDLKAVVWDNTAGKFKLGNVSAGNVATGAGSPLAFKGDLYTYSTENARISVGTDEQVLTADSSQSSGLRWRDPWLGVLKPIRVDLTEDYTLDADSEPIILFDSGGSDRNIILPDPTLKPYAFQLINRTQNDNIHVRETVGGPILAVLNTASPLAYVYSDGLQHTLVTLGSI